MSLSLGGSGTLHKQLVSNDATCTTFSFSSCLLCAGKTFDAITKSTTAILVHDSNFKEIMNILMILLCQHMFAACMYWMGYVLLYM